MAMAKEKQVIFASSTLPIIDAEEISNAIALMQYKERHSSKPAFAIIRVQVHNLRLASRYTKYRIVASKKWLKNFISAPSAAR